MTLHPVLPAWLVVLLGALALAGCGWLVRRALPDERLRAWTHLALAALLTLLLLRPGIGSADQAAAANDLEVLVVLDRTTSMTARDWDGGRSRLEGARAELRRVAHDLGGARMSLITFASTAHRDLPFTSDLDAFASALAGVEPEDPLEGTGSSMSRPIPVMATILAAAQQRHPERRRIVLFLSDGEDTDTSTPQVSLAGLERYVSGGVVVGYGSEQGATMPLPANQGAGTIPDASGAAAVTRLHEDTLKAVADQLGIDYLHSTEPGDLRSAVAGIDRTLITGGDDRPARVDLTWLVGLLLGLLTLVELRRVTRERAVAAAELPARSRFRTPGRQVHR